MNKMVVKVAKKGEGKTKWLLDVAKNAKDSGHNVLIYTDDCKEFDAFCDKYLNLFNEVCPVKHLSKISEVNKNDVVLVDNLFKYDVSITDFTCIENNCYKLFLTIEGDTEYEFENISETFVQMKINFEE